MQAADIDAKIASFPRWHYEFELNGHRTPIFDPSHRNRHQQRGAYFFDPLVRVFGGSLAGKRVLDLGCNAGYWSLRAVDAGCDFVLGIDGRQMHIDQANLVFELQGVEPSRYQFIPGDVYATDLSIGAPFEIAFCLGLLYHVSDPMTLIQRISEVNTELLVIDTGVTPLPGKFFQLAHDSEEDPRNALRDQFVLNPSRQAVIALAASAGYSVATLRPAFDSYEGALDYKHGSRRAFLCARDPSLLTAIADKTEHETPPRLAADAGRWAIRSVSGAIRSRTRALLGG